MTTHTRPTDNRATAPVAPTDLQSTWLVTEREIKARLRSKSFVISTVILLVIVLASVVVGGVLSSNPSQTPVAVVGTAGQAVEQVPDLRLTQVPDVAAAERLVRDGTVDAALVPNPASTLGFKVLAEDKAPTSLVAQLSVSPSVELLNPDAVNPGVLYLVALGFGLVFFMSAMTFGSTIAQSVVEEKSTRIVEILMSAVPVRVLLAGKVLGNSILAFGQIAVISALTVVGLTVTGQTALLTGLGTPLVWFVIFFAVGFVLLAAMFAAAASLVSRQEDVAATTTPVTMLVMIPYFMVIFFNDNATVLTVMSYVPFSAPVGMPVRLFVGSADWWEPLASLLLLVATTAVVIVVGARVYRNSLLRTGARVPLREALRG
jgi:ABC-2 type transport system permease protein